MHIAGRTAALFAALTLLAASGPPSWLDAATPANWNVAGAALPTRSGARDAALAPGGRCQSSTRPPTSLEDRALVLRGWTPVGAYQRYGATVVVTATSSVDGMCRPNGFQGFVFVNGAFAGTISPKLMDARTDGALASLSVQIYNPNDISADFARYGSADPLCCPHATTSVTYRVQTAVPRVAPLSATTHANPA